MYALVRTWVGHLNADFLEPGTLQAEGRMDPAVGIEDLGGHIILRNAVNRIPKVLAGSDKNGATNENDEGRPIVKSKDGIVNDTRLCPDKVLQTLKQGIHLESSEQSD